jgi:hypothetical protein
LARRYFFILKNIGARRMSIKANSEKPCIFVVKYHAPPLVAEKYSSCRIFLIDTEKSQHVKTYE